MGEAYAHRPISSRNAEEPLRPAITEKKEACDNYMDKKELGKEAAEDVTRESLIAISESVPESSSPDSGFSPQPPPPPQNSRLVNGGDQSENYRSQLISISYTESTEDEIVPPVAQPEEVKAA